MSTELTVDLSAMTTEALREELARTFEITIDNLGRAAAIVRELERRGVDLAELRIGLVAYLRQIANGRLTARAVVRFAERPMLLRAIADLPVEEQDRLAAGEPVRLAVFGSGTSEVSFRMANPLDLTPDQVRMVFGSGGIRTVEQQVPLLEDRRVKANSEREPKPTLRSGRLFADKDRGGLVFRRTFFPAADVVAALAAISQSDDDDSAADATVVAKISEAQHQRLKIMAAQRNTSISDLVRSALKAHGLI